MFWSWIVFLGSISSSLWLQEDTWKLSVFFLSCFWEHNKVLVVERCWSSCRYVVSVMVVLCWSQNKYHTVQNSFAWSLSCIALCMDMYGLCMDKPMVISDKSKFIHYFSSATSSSLLTQSFPVKRHFCVLGLHWGSLKWFIWWWCLQNNNQLSLPGPWSTVPVGTSAGALCALRKECWK